MLRKQKTGSKANLLYFPGMEMDAVTDWLLEAELISNDPSQGSLESAQIRSPKSLNEVIAMAPSFFLCLAKTLESRLLRSEVRSHFPTLLCRVNGEELASVESYTEIEIDWLPAIYDTLESVQFLPEPHESHRRHDTEAQTAASETVAQMLADLQGLEETDAPGIGNPVPEKVIHLLGRAFIGRQFDSEDLQPISKMITGWDNRSARLSLFAFDLQRSRRTLSILKALVQNLITQSNHMRNRLDDKLAAMKELAYGASHEFNNPLANIATRAQTLARDETHSDRKQQLQIINAQAFRGFDMLANLMHFASPPKPKLESCDLNLIMARSIKEVEQFFGSELKSHFSLAMPSPAPFVWCDTQQLNLLLKFILRNAVEAGGPEIKITCGESELPTGETAIEVQVSDTGKAVERQLLAKMCDPFFSGREAGRGLGFGLAIAYQIVRQHRGQISLTSLQPQGLRVAILLPAQKA